MTDALGWRKKFGVLAPSTNTIVEPDFHAMAVRGVTSHISRIHIRDQDLSSDEKMVRILEQIDDEILFAVDRVITAGIDYLIMAMSAETFWEGLKGNRAFVKRLEDCQHIDEIPLLFEEYGVSSFKIFMFSGGYGLHGLSDQQNLFLMINKEERYDFAHFEFIMRGLTRLMEKHPEARDTISLSLHCEVAEILNAYTKIVENDSSLSGLHAYSAARPPHSEGLAICIAAYLAHETNCANINLLHLSSRKAMEAALTMQTAFPHINFRREVTIGHLLLDVDTPSTIWAKVNPPIRPRADVEYLWQAVLNNQVDWIVSDHACCSAEQKRSAKDSDNIWLAKSGFGGTEYLLSGLFSEGSKRGMSYNHIANLLCWNPSRRFGLLEKGDIAIGYDADLVLVNPNETFVVSAAESESQQGYTPFEGVELTGRVKSTFLRGNLIFNNGQVLASPTGRYLKRSRY
ncbi:amidohydrolase family protein [Nostoc sp.]|uniref:amidohydrolase family protein n=1 Tax=Nostoc sp. TaxID=1180 RepID=UPI002FF5A4D5